LSLDAADGRLDGRYFGSGIVSGPGFATTASPFGPTVVNQYPTYTSTNYPTVVGNQTFVGNQTSALALPSTVATSPFFGSAALSAPYPTVGGFNQGFQGYQGFQGFQGFNQLSTVGGFGVGGGFGVDHGFDYPNVRVVGEKVITIRVPIFERVGTPQIQYIERAVPQVLPPQIQYIERPTEKIVYVDKPVERIVYVDRPAPLPVPAPVPLPPQPVRQEAGRVAVKQQYNINDARVAEEWDMRDGVRDGKMHGTVINCDGYQVKAKQFWEASDNQMAQDLDMRYGVRDGKSFGTDIRTSTDGVVDGRDFGRR